MAHLIQVGVGSGGMPVLDMIARDPRITQITIIEPDVYKPHNVERHLFPLESVGELKAELAMAWLLARRADLQITLHTCDLMAPEQQSTIEAACVASDFGICAVDNEPAKYHWDRLMRAASRPWTLGEVLSGGIGGFVHWFLPGGACYGCTATRLKRSVTVDNPTAPDYSQPNGAVHETTIPASMASIHAIASLHALLTTQLMDVMASEDDQQRRRKLLAPGFTSMLMPLQQVSGIFKDAFTPIKLSIDRSEQCLICNESEDIPSGAELSSALDEALSRLADD